MRRRFIAPLVLLLIVIRSGMAVGADDPWTLTPDVELVTRWPTSSGALREDRVTAELYRPRAAEGRVPAAVIINSSGGVQPHTEFHYARTLAREGMAALVVDSFTPRGVRRTGDDQGRVWQVQSDADAVAGFRWLAAQPWVDPRRIIVLGMSRGGAAALHTALEQYRAPLRATDIRFAAHVAIATGGCNLPARDARTNGAPIFFMLAELDHGTPAEPCLDYARRMRAAGNREIRIAVYPGVYHAYEGTAGLAYVAEDETGRACAGRYVQDARRRLFDRATGLPVAPGRERAFLLETCLERGYTVGGDARVKAQATADLLQFLRDVEVLHDTEARAVVPDCAPLPEGLLRRNCTRARNGWPGDLVALARAFRQGGPRRDDALAVRLLELAAARGNDQARWELALALRQGAGVARDLPRALALARTAAEAGDATGMNVYAVMLRDGIGTAPDDAGAVLWFQRSAALRDRFALANLGRMLWDGRGGLARDRVAAVVLWRRAAFVDHPWAHLFLGEAHETGEGVAQDRVAALHHYRAAAARGDDPAVRQRAAEAIARLEAATRVTR